MHEGRSVCRRNAVTVLVASILASGSLFAGTNIWERAGLLPAATVGERKFSAARWLWRDDIPTPPGSECLFRRSFELPKPVASAKFACRMDDGGTIYLNGHEIGVGDFERNLRVGLNVLAAKVKNKALAAGLIFAADISLSDGSAIRLVSDTSTKVAASAEEDWWLPEYDDSRWVPAIDQGDVLQLPWSARTDLALTADFATAGERAAIAAERRRIDPIPAGLSAEPEPRAEVVTFGHRSKILLNGRVYEPELFLLGTAGAGNRFARDIVLKTSAMGFRLFEIMLDTADFECGNGVYDFTCAEKRVCELIRLAPEAYVSLHINFDLPKWCAENPDETIKYADPQPGIKATDEFTGVPVRPSAASRKFRAEAETVIRRLGAHIASGAWGKRVAMIRVSWGVYTEWHMYGMQNAPDVSRPMVASFGRNPPPVAVRRHEKAVLDEKEDAELIAWNFHQQNEIADLLIGLTAAVKREIPGRLVGAYYGYIWDIFCPEGANSLLGKVLDAPTVDYLSAPSPYFGTVRFGGGSYHSRSIPDAFRRRGKLFLTEDDSRHSQTVGWARERHRVKTPELSVAVMKRNYLNGLFDGSGIQFADPFYGVGQRLNSFDDPLLLKALQDSRLAASAAGTVSAGQDADVLVVVSERERLMRDSFIEKPGKPVVHWRRLYSYLPDFLYRTGVPLDFVRLEDFLADSTKPKAVVLLNEYHLTPDERTRLSERLKGIRVMDFTKAELPGSATAWRRLFEREGLVPAVPLNTYFRRQGDLFMVHTGDAGRLSVRPGIVGAAGYCELFSGKTWPGNDVLEIETNGPETFLFKVVRR